MYPLLTLADNLMAVSGLMRVTSGEIYFRGERIDRLPPHRIVERGICQVPEGRRIFPRLTVDENLEMGSFTRRDREQIASDRKLVEEMFPVLAERRTQQGGTLSGGEQQMHAIARLLHGDRAKLSWKTRAPPSSLTTW